MPHTSVNPVLRSSEVYFITILYYISLAASQVESLSHLFKGLIHYGH